MVRFCRPPEVKNGAVSFNNLQGKQLYLYIGSVQQNKEAWFDFACHLSKFDGVLFFLNANFTQIIHFYIYKLHKALEDNKICLMFTKSNMALSKMDGESLMLRVSFSGRGDIWQRRRGCSSGKARRQKGFFSRLAGGRAEK
jgi:hypothetical protein